MDQEMSFIAKISGPPADLVANILRVPGDMMRNVVVAIEPPWAKGIFIAYFILLMVWVITIPKEEMRFKLESANKEISLRPFALLSLTTCIVIYLVF